MMVMRPSTMSLRTPPGSRGTSPVRVGVVPKKTPSPQRGPVMVRRKSPSKATPPRRTRGISPSGSSRSNSPTKSLTGSLESFPRSRGSDAGSIERLDESGQITRIITTHPQTEDNINVVVRVRPLSTKEQRGGGESVVQFPGNGQVLCDGTPGGPSGGQKPKLFSYNVVFEPGATQEDVLEYSGIKRLLEMAVEGFGCTVFCYGQTGSGKTHTLTGPPGLFVKRPNPNDADHGLVFRSFCYLFQLIKERSDFQFVLKASFLEIYNEKVIDLLNPGSSRKPLAVRWSKKARGFFVENLFTVDCEELDDLMAVLEEGMRNRKVGSHSMNDYSSRSHTILTVRIYSEQAAESGVFISRQGKINFVDLAGSEMTKKTHSEGKTLEEANNINKSLMVLGYCIASLSDNKKRSGHIPYRDSKLTKLLADSLAGNGVTLMIACISPARYNLCETLNTLRYAARAKKIRTKPIVVMDPREALILSLKREVSVLQTENEHLKSVLHVNGQPAAENRDIQVLKTGDINTERYNITPAPPVDLEKLTELEGSEITELVKLYMRENEALRKENAELYSTRELVMRDQELVCRENERLLKKLEEVNSVCCRSPIIPARSTLSADNMVENDTTNVWTNPLNNSETNIAEANIHSPSNQNGGNRAEQIPESIQKELDKRRIGNSMTNIADMYRSSTHRRQGSWDGRPESADGGTSVRRSNLQRSSQASIELSDTQRSPSPLHPRLKPKSSKSSDSISQKTSNVLKSEMSQTNKPKNSLLKTRVNEIIKSNRSRRDIFDKNLEKNQVFGSMISLYDDE